MNSSQPVLASLPYYDLDIENAQLKARVEAEIARELKRTPKLASDPRVPPDFELFKGNELLKAELARVEAKQTLNALDTIRYTLPDPVEPNRSEADWERALNNARSQLEHILSRQANLQLLQQYGPNAWKVHNYLLEADEKSMEAELETLKNRVTELNRERKNSQLKTGKTLTELETKWTELVSTVLQLELANVALDAEVEQLRQQELAMES